MSLLSQRCLLIRSNGNREDSNWVIESNCECGSCINKVSSGELEIGYDILGTKPLNLEATTKWSKRKKKRSSF